jgi:hypothetical protein
MPYYYPPRSGAALKPVEDFARRFCDPTLKDGHLLSTHNRRVSIFEELEITEMSKVAIRGGASKPTL